MTSDTLPCSPPTNCDGLTYDAWMAKANAYVASKTEGLGLDDLPDGPSHDSWDAGDDPCDYARDILEEEFGEGFDDEESEA